VTTRGFILQPTYRLESGKAIVQLYGRLESGETFLIRDDRLRPFFFIRRTDGSRVRSLEDSSSLEDDWDRERQGLGRLEILEDDRATFRGTDPVLRVVLPTPAAAPRLRDRLHRAGIPTYEADVRFARRYLLERGIRSSIQIEGPSTPGSGTDIVFHNPEITPSRWALEPRILSLDIETDPRARRLLSVALVGCGAREVLLMCPPPLGCPEGAYPFGTEKALLQALCQRIRELDPDVLTGWNVIDFDFRVLAEIAQRCGISLDIGRGPGGLRLRPVRAGRNALEATVPGRLILDGVRLLRGSFIVMEEYSLNFVARKVLGEGKTALEPASGTKNHGAAILEQFHQDRERFVEYNLQDARLVLDILERLGLVALAVERSLLTGLPLDRVSSSVAAFDFLYLSKLTERGLVAPSVSSPEVPREGASGGGHVLEPKPGLYRNVLVFDFQSLYPSIIRTFQIDPLGWVPIPQDGEDLIVAPNGAAFRRGQGQDQGILPALLDDLVPRRVEAKARGDAVTSQAIKILMNSFYGVLGTSVCRFHHPMLTNAITGFGRELLLWTKARLEEEGYEVLYGDTDSLFVLSGEEDPGTAHQKGEALVTVLNDALEQHIQTTWGVESRLELELEVLYLRLFFPSMRRSTAGARKRYAGLVEVEGSQKVVFTGLEAVRRDWTELARQVQREIYRRLFFDRPVEAYLKQVVQELRDGRLDDLLIYRKALRKPLGAYTSTSPPHVVAARKMSGKPPRLIRYVITKHGPEPVDGAQGELDHEHYVAKQVRPVAEPILTLLGLSFEKVVGDDRQLELF